MDITTLAKTAYQYDALLCRYAGFIIKDKEQAQRLVVGVFELYYEQTIPLKEPILRRWLHTRTRRACNDFIVHHFITNLQSSKN